MKIVAENKFYTLSIEAKMEAKHSIDKYDDNNIKDQLIDMLRAQGFSFSNIKVED